MGGKKKKLVNKVVQVINIYQLYSDSLSLYKHLTYVCYALHYSNKVRTYN